jgi:hypothetical protein
MTPPPRPQPVTDGDVEALAMRLEAEWQAAADEIGGEVCADIFTEASDMLRTLLTERAAHAQAVAQAREEGEREGIKKAAAKCEQLASVIKPGDGNLAAAWANGCDDCQKAIEGIALIPTPSQEDPLSEMSPFDVEDADFAKHASTVQTDEEGRSNG